MFFNHRELFIIAEIGVNHEGDINKAKELIKLAKKAGSDAVKFQVYTPWRYSGLTDIDRFNRVSKFSLSEAQFLDLKEVAHNEGITIFASAISEDWVPFLAKNTDIIKIASGDLTFKPVIEAAAKMAKKVILSTGCANMDEIAQAIAWFKCASSVDNIKDQLCLMHCVSAYPTPMEVANISAIAYLKEKFGLEVGYSNHVEGIDASLGAIALGARVIEVHFTDQKHGRDFRDHALSLEWQDLKELRQRADNIIQSLGKFDKFVMNCEKDNRKIIRKGLIAAENLSKGHILTQEDIAFARPGAYFSSNDISKVIGKELQENVQKGFMLLPNCLK